MVRDRVGEGLQLLRGQVELRGAVHKPVSELGVEAADLFLGLLAIGDVLDGAVKPYDPAVGIVIGFAAGERLSHGAAW